MIDDENVIIGYGGLQQINLDIQFLLKVTEIFCTASIFESEQNIFNLAGNKYSSTIVSLDTARPLKPQKFYTVQLQRLSAKISAIQEEFDFNYNSD